MVAVAVDARRWDQPGQRGQELEGERTSSVRPSGVGREGGSGCGD
jgi:hypothetical protein